MKTILVDAVNTFVTDGKIYEDMHKLLDKFPNKKIIVTNANDEQLVTFGLTNLPYELFTLKHNPDKTDPKYFEEMFKALSLSPANVIYFEHNPDSVKSAQSVGILTYHYDKDAHDLFQLEKFLSENI